MNCPKCNADVQAGWVACPACSERLPQKAICGNCKKEIDPEWKACPFCGQATVGGAVSASTSADGDSSVNDAVVQGNIDQSRGKVDGGVHVYAGVPAQATHQVVACPLCGVKNEEKGTFRCQRCGRDHLCQDHLDRVARCCEECAAGAQAVREPEKEVEVSGIRFMYVPPGEFLMGSPESDQDAFDYEKPQQSVRITRGFYMGKYPVIQAQYEAVMGETPSHFGGGSRPVEMVSWHDAVAFCEKLSAQCGQEGRLPTEAEWEYACRAGTQTRYCFGDDAQRLGEYAWFNGNSGSETHPVGQKRANAWGLHDMHGNVWEWCSDWYDEGYYAQSLIEDPPGPAQGVSRVLRGGSWSRSAALSRSAYRGPGGPSASYKGGGFRVALCVRSSGSFLRT